MSTNDDEAARKMALRMLERRALSRAELRDRLVKKGCGRDGAARVALGLADLGLVNDRALGESVVRMELLRAPSGAARLEAKLARRGIDGSTAREIVREALCGRDEAEDAETVARRRLRALPDALAPEVVRRRLLGVLARRGFGGEQSRAAVERVLGEQDDPDRPDPYDGV